MQVVIDIPQKLYKELTTVTVTHAGEVFAQKLIIYIKNGIPLPKGHGKLIDTSELLTVTDVREDGSEVTYVLYDDIENADTVIEKDGD